MDDSPAPPAACTVGTRRDRLRCHLETAETITGQIINGAIVGLIFLSALISLARAVVGPAMTMMLASANAVARP